MKHLTTSLVVLGVCAVIASSGEASPREDMYLVPIPMSAVHHGAARGPRIWEDTFNGTSTNWSGYAVPASTGSVTDVKGSWIVPTVERSKSANTYSSNWVGIDGYSSSTVEQIGTEQDWTGGRHGAARYYAWFEMYPNAAYMIGNFPVDAGDTITAEVSYSGGDYTLTITNETQNVTYTRTDTISGAQNSSAEWVVEAPWLGRVLPLADFGTTYLSDCTATIDGTTGPISTWDYDAITMVWKRGNKAVPSILSSSGDAFSVTWYHE